MLQARPPAAGALPIHVSDADVVRAYLDDASAYPGGRADAVVRPFDEGELARGVRALSAQRTPMHPQAARTSVTGGAVPAGGVVVSVERLDAVGPVRASGGGALVRVGAGVRLSSLERALSPTGWFYPPAPTYREAMIGGTIATNAGGAATFKYGVTRDWVRALTVVLANGDVLNVERGEAAARPGEPFRILRSDGSVIEATAPTYRLPRLKKLSAGYFAADPLDLVDLFAGSEGTLGVIAGADVVLAIEPAAVLTGLAFVASTRVALDLAAALRAAAARSRAEGDRRGPDVRAIELIDGHALDLLRERDPAARRPVIPARSGGALIFQVELPQPATRDEAASLLAAYLNGGPRPADGPIVRLFSLLDRHDALDDVDLALPDDAPRAAAIAAMREAVPTCVNELLAERRRHDPAITKVAGDLIVPTDELYAMVGIYEQGFAARGLAFAIWGHVSDGNLHPNALPRNAAEVAAARDAQLEFAREAVRRGGAPLSEHGVGRSSLKKQLLREFLGEPALAEMQAIKRAFDPDGLLAPGVLFS